MLKTYLNLKKWNLLQYTGLACLIVVCVIQVIKRENYRVQNYNIDTINRNISTYKSELNASFQLTELPDIREQWKYVAPIASNYAVSLNLEAPSTYSNLPAWNGSFSGKAPLVLSALNKLQTTVPTFIKKIKVNNGNIDASFSVVGKDN